MFGRHAFTVKGVFAKHASNLKACLANTTFKIHHFPVSWKLPHLTNKVLKVRHFKKNSEMMRSTSPYGNEPQRIFCHSFRKLQISNLFKYGRKNNHHYKFLKSLLLQLPLCYLLPPTLSTPTFRIFLKMEWIITNNINP